MRVERLGCGGHLLESGGHGFGQSVGYQVILGEVLGWVAQSTARLSQEFKQAVWAEQAAEKRVRNWG